MRDDSSYYDPPIISLREIRKTGDEAKPPLYAVLPYETRSFRLLIKKYEVPLLQRASSGLKKERQNR